MKGMMAAVISSVLLLCAGCGGTDGYGAQITKEEQETEYSTVYAEVIEFGGFQNKEYESELNMNIENDVAAAIAEFDSMAQEAAEELPQGVKSDLHITESVTRNSGGIISWVEEHYVYLGGAHGTTSWYPRTVDLRAENPHALTLSELFNSDDYRDKINNMIDELIKENPDKYGELWAEPHINADTENRFYLTDEELVIYFPPYELSYYARGFVEFPIRLADLRGYLKEEYRITE